MSRSPRIRVAIDRLVLRGVEPADAAAIRRALVTELQAHLAATDPAAFVGGSGRRHLRLGIGAGADPASFGREAARALHRTLATPPTRGRR
jgi:hypothetical protein